MTALNNKRIAKNTLMLYIRMFLVMGVSLYTSRIVLNALGVGDYGIYNVVGGVVAMLAFLNGVMSVASSRFLTFELGRGDFVRLKRVFCASLTLHISIALIVFVLAETVGLWFVMNRLVIPADRLDAAMWVYQFSVFTCMVNLTQVPYNAAIVAHERMATYAYFSILEVILKLAIALILMFVLTDKLRLYAILVFVVTLIIASVYRMYCRRSFAECRYRLFWDGVLYKTLLSFSAWDLIGSSSVIVQGQGLNILLNLFFGPAVNAARAVSVQVQSAMMLFGNSFLTAVRPQIIKLYATDNIDRMMSLVFNSSKYGYFLIYLVVAPLFLETPTVLRLWLKDVPEYSVVFCRYMLVISLLNVMRTPFVSVLHATGKIKIGNIITGTILMMTFPLAWLFLHLGYSPVSVFTVTLVITLLSQVADLFVIRHYVYFSVKSYYRRVLLRCFAVSVIPLILSGLLKYMCEPDFIRLCMTVGLSCTLTCISVFYIGLNDCEKKIVKSKIHQKIKSWIKSH